MATTELRCLGLLNLRRVPHRYTAHGNPHSSIQSNIHGLEQGKGGRTVSSARVHQRHMGFQQVLTQGS